MGQNQSTQSQQQLQRDRSIRQERTGRNNYPNNIGVENPDQDLYRSRSSRSGFADTSVSAFRRTLRRIRDWLMQKSQPKVDIIELSQMSTSPNVTSQGDDNMSVSEAFEVVLLDEKTLDEIEEPVKDFGILDLNAANANDSGNSGKNAIELQEVKNFAKNLDEEVKTELEYLDFPFLTDIETIQWLKKNRVVFVMRGLPGSGKSTLVNAISKVYDSETPVICSADHYFIDENGVYRFDQSRLKDAHEASQSLMKTSCEDGKRLIIVDNTNVQTWEMKSYFNHANKAPYTYKVIVVEPKTPWKFDASELSEKNSHGVSVEILRKRIKSFEMAVPLYFGWFLSPKDSRSIYDRAMILFKNLYESCDEFKHNFGEFSSMLNWGSAMNFYSREMMVDKKMVLHCTAKFCGGSFQFKKKSSDINPSLKEYINKVQDNLGTVQRLKIIGYFFTKETVGCRVQLDCDQLECYDQKEKLNSSDMKRQYGPAPKPTETKNKDDFKESVTIEEEFPAKEKSENSEKDNRFQPIVASEKGCRAHLTLATAPGAKPVNAGIDLMEIVQAEEKKIEKYSYDIPYTEDVLKHYSENLWVVYLKDAISVKSIFTGYY